MSETQTAHRSSQTGKGLLSGRLVFWLWETPGFKVSGAGRRGCEKTSCNLDDFQLYFIVWHQKGLFYQTLLLMHPCAIFRDPDEWRESQNLLLCTHSNNPHTATEARGYQSFLFSALNGVWHTVFNKRIDGRIGISRNRLVQISLESALVMYVGTNLTRELQGLPSFHLLTSSYCRSVSRLSSEGAATKSRPIRDIWRWKQAQRVQCALEVGSVLNKHASETTGRTRRYPQNPWVQWFPD